MPEFWESDSVVTPNQPQEDWWSKDSVVSEAAAPAPPGQGATFGRELAASIAPTVGAALGGVGGFSAGTAAAPSLGPAAPAAPLVGSFIGSLAGGALTELAQSEILKRTSPEFLEQLKAGRAEHPWTAFGARMAAAVPIFTIAPGQTVRGLMALPAVLRQAATQAQKEATKAAAIQLGMGTAGGVVAPLLHGEAPTVRGVLESAAQAATFGRPRFTAAPPVPRPATPERVTVRAEPPSEVVPVQIGRVESVGQKLLTEGTPAKEPVVQEQAPPPKEAPEAAGEVKMAAAEQPAPAPQPAVTPKPAESQPGEQVARAEPIPAEPVPEPRTGRQPQRPTSKLLIDPYSTPMLERLDSIGGPVSKAVAAEGRQIDSRRAELIGSISQPLDKAKRLAAKALRGGTTWIRQRGKVTPYAATGRLHTLEGNDRNAVVAMAPPRAQEMVGALWDANTPAIGGLAAQANVKFAPRGLIQRILTNRGIDTVLEGGGVMHDRWVEGLAVANNKPVSDVKTIFTRWKAELDAPSPDVARLDQIAQDFHREFPRVITHVRIGPKWIELIESDPVNYLNKAAERTASAVAFREVYPATDQGRQYLAKTREAVQAELPTNRRKNEFDNLITVLQGHRFDVSPKMLATASASPVGALAAEAGGVITRPLRAGMLSLSAIANAAESVIGGPAIFMRFRHILPLLTRNPRTFSAQLEMTGARDPIIRNMAYNPTKPAESISRILSEGINRLTLNSFMNEVQEYSGAGSARIFADRVRANQLTAEEQRWFRNVLRAAGFRENPEAIVQGQDLQGLAQFERQAAPFLSGGADRPATASRWGNSRFFNALFWFHRYPQMVLNQFRGITNNLLEDARRHDWRSLGENALLMAKFLGAKAAQGALANLFVAWVKEQFDGTEQRMREAKQSFGKFVVDSAVTGFGGPLAIAMRLFQPRVRNAQDAAVELLKVSAPISSTMDAINAIGGMDRYEGLPAFDRTAQLLESKTPITPIVRSVAAIMGLADDNPKLRTARNAFYRWTEKQGWSYPKGQPKDAEFTAGMRKVAKKFETGGDYKTELIKTLRAKAAKGEDAFKSAAQSLSHRMLLRNQHGGQLTAEEIKSLQAWLGPENFQLLQKRDAMIDALSDALKE